MYNGTEIKQYAQVKYLVCILDQSLSSESMALNVIDKVIDSRLKFLHKTKPFFNIPLCSLLCNALIQPLFDYACTAWFSNLSKRLKLCLQESQNKCIRFYLQLDKRSKICVKEFLQLNWLKVHDRYLLFIASDIFKFKEINDLTILLNVSVLLVKMVQLRSLPIKIKATFLENKTKLVLCWT